MSHVLRIFSACIAQGSITSAVPADFDGDGGMDLLLTLRMGADDSDDADASDDADGHHALHGMILWGNHDDEGRHELTCLEDQPQAWRKVFPLAAEPLVFDYNYDYVADLLTVSRNGTRCVLVFSTDRSAPYDTVHLDSPRFDHLKAQHANAFVDLNSDGEADVLLTTQSGLELYYRLDGGALVYHSHVAWPPGLVGGGGCTVDLCVGQAVFTDFDLNGQLDLILPVCFDTACRNSSMYLIPVTELGTAAGGTWRWTPMSLDLGKLTFLTPEPGESRLRLLAPRLGDIDLDGFPDLLMPLFNRTSGAPETHLLLNTPCGAYAACQPFWRQYQLRPSFMQGKII